MDPAHKERLLASFGAYLDTVGEAPQDAAAPVETEAASREPGAAAAGDAAPDLFTLLAEVATLKNEVKRESRQVKTALDEFRELFDALRDANARAADEQQRRREQEQTAHRRGHKDLLLELLELRDRLAAGHEHAASYRPRGLFGRRRARALAASMAEGLAMNLRRLDETLARRGVHPLPALEQPFDPHRMHAAEVTDDPEIPAGQVVAELRTGFLLDEQVLRTAEVVVNRPGSSSGRQAPPRPSAAAAGPSPPASMPADACSTQP